MPDIRAEQEIVIRIDRREMDQLPVLAREVVDYLVKYPEQRNGWLMDTGHGCRVIGSWRIE